MATDQAYQILGAVLDRRINSFITVDRKSVFEHFGLLCALEAIDVALTKTSKWSNTVEKAFCLAIKAVQENYTFDAPEQAACIRQLSNTNSVEEMDAILKKWDISGYDLTTSL